MLILSRRPHESFTIELSSNVDPFTLVGEIFNKPIKVRYVEGDGDQITLEIDGPNELSIVRGELLEKSID